MLLVHPLSYLILEKSIGRGASVCMSSLNLFVGGEDTPSSSSSSSSLGLLCRLV